MPVIHAADPLGCWICGSVGVPVGVPQRFDEVMTDDLITVALIELVRRMVGDVGIQHHDFAALPVRVALYPVHKLLTDTGTAIRRADDHVVDVQIAPTPETRSQPDPRHTETAIISTS